MNDDDEMDHSGGDGQDDDRLGSSPSSAAATVTGLKVSVQVQRQLAQFDYEQRLEYEVNNKLDALRARRQELFDAIATLESERATLLRRRDDTAQRARRLDRRTRRDKRRDEPSTNGSGTAGGAAGGAADDGEQGNKVTLRNVSEKLIQTRSLLSEFDRKWGFKRRHAWFSWHPREADDERLLRKCMRKVRNT